MSSKFAQALGIELPRSEPYQKYPIYKEKKGDYSSPNINIPHPLGRAPFSLGVPIWGGLNRDIEDLLIDNEEVFKDPVSVLLKKSEGGKKRVTDNNAVWQHLGQILANPLSSIFQGLQNYAEEKREEEEVAKVLNDQLFKKLEEEDKKSSGSGSNRELMEKERKRRNEEEIERRKKWDPTGEYWSHLLEDESEEEQSDMDMPLKITDPEEIKKRQQQIEEERKFLANPAAFKKEDYRKVDPVEEERRLLEEQEEKLKEFQEAQQSKIDNKETEESLDDWLKRRASKKFNQEKEIDDWMEALEESYKKAHEEKGLWDPSDAFFDSPTLESNLDPDYEDKNLYDAFNLDSDWQKENEGALTHLDRIWEFLGMDESDQLSHQFPSAFSSPKGEYTDEEAIDFYLDELLRDKRGEEHEFNRLNQWNQLEDTERSEHTYPKNEEEIDAFLENLIENVNDPNYTPLIHLDKEELEEDILKAFTEKWSNWSQMNPDDQEYEEWLIEEESSPERSMFDPDLTGIPMSPEDQEDDFITNILETKVNRADDLFDMDDDNLWDHLTYDPFELGWGSNFGDKDEWLGEDDNDDDDDPEGLGSARIITDQTRLPPWVGRSPADIGTKALKALHLLQGQSNTFRGENVYNRGLPTPFTSFDNMFKQYQKASNTDFGRDLPFYEQLTAKPKNIWETLFGTNLQSLGNLKTAITEDPMIRTLLGRTSAEYPEYGRPYPYEEKPF